MTSDKALTKLSAEGCSNSILMYNKMVELSEQLVMEEEVSTSCPACPKGEDDDLCKISGLGGFKNTWIDQNLIKRFDTSAKSDVN
ncbi:hypothetical protein INT47_005066 [Mucor saturninus]|uniref:Uncharacterized protein n=1 Tax=Mucor saturninus TaxID=64648 RepID=A0A8H7UQY6_9FUNG|nr:hypothetical protein INT47_005066 [Mucor saturninus]